MLWNERALNRCKTDVINQSTIIYFLNDYMQVLQFGDAGFNACAVKFSFSICLLYRPLCACMRVHGPTCVCFQRNA